MPQTRLLCIAYIQVVIVGVTLPQTTGENAGSSILSIKPGQMI